MDISERQKQILIAIIEEFMDTAEEIGSSVLVSKHGLGVSPATIRNEMCQLMDAGYLEKSHASSGRTPTDQAIRLYVHERMKENMIDVVDLVQIRQGLFKVRFYPEKLLEAILKTLVEESNAVSFIVMDDMARYYGASNLMNYRELKDLKVLQRVLDLLEDQSLLKQVFSKFVGEDVAVVIGSESGIRDLEDCAMVFSKFKFWKNKYGHMGVIGSRRLDYEHILPVMETIRDTINESLKGWK